MRMVLPMFAAALAGCADDAPPDAEIVPPVPIACAKRTSLYATGETIRLDLEGCGGIELDQMRVVGEGSLRLDLFTDGTRLLPRVEAESDATFEAVHLSGAWWAAGAREAALWRQGYRSESTSGVVPLAGIALDERGLPVVGGHDGALESETPYTSWWAGLVGRPDGGAVHAGTISAATTRTWVAFGPDEVHVVWGGTGERVQLAEGDAVYLDPLWLAVGGDPNALWQDWAEAVAAATPPRPLPDAPPTGWTAAWAGEGALTEDDIRAGLAVAADLDPALRPLDVIRIRDDWALARGDWRPNERFPSGMEALAADIAAAGLTPGVELAPFLVDRSARVYAEHQDWWVRDALGEELDVDGFAVIDATHPDAGAWLAQQVAARVAEGFGFLELDRLYAGALEGDRYLDLTGAQAYVHAMAQIREAAGDAWLLACGAPMLPTVGYAESWCSGPGPGADPQHAAWLRDQVGATAARSFVNGVWWFNDPGPMRPGLAATDEEARAAVVAQAVSGGTWTLGDDLVGLAAPRLAWTLEPAAFETAGGPVVPRRALDAAPPVRWDLPDGTIALLNLTTAAADVHAPGGTELLTGETAGAGVRTIEPGRGELWRP